MHVYFEKIVYLQNLKEFRVQKVLNSGLTVYNKVWKTDFM